MKLGILLTGHVPEDLSSDTVNYPVMYRDLFTLGESTPEFQFYNTWQGELPDSFDECGAWIVTGGQFNAWQDEEWMLKLGDFIKNCHQERRKLLGICFGHQIIAHSLGGRCTVAKQGWGVGQRNFLILKLRPWMSPAAKATGLLYSHQDQVVQLPREAELLARSEFCPVEMFSIGQHVFCMQGHPEFSADYARALWGTRRQELGTEILTKAQESISPKFNNDMICRWINRFLGVGV